MRSVAAGALLLLALGLLGGRPGAAPAGWPGLRTRGAHIVDQRGNEVILKGFGPGEWTNTEAYMLHWPDRDPGPSKHASQYGYTAIHKTLARIMGDRAAATYWETWKLNDVTEADFARMQAWGANSLRLSINYHWLSPAPGTYLASGWQWLDQIVAWGRAHGIRIVFCLHAAPGAQSGYLMADARHETARLWTQPATYQPWTIDLWRAIARHFANEPFVAGYDLLDEPIPPKGHDADVRPFYIALTRAIRSVDARHILFVEGLHFAGNVRGIQAMLPPWDDNMVLVFHKYWDRNDQASIQGYVDIRNRYAIPLWNGETGENSSGWLRAMVALLARNDIGWNSWTYKKLNVRGSVAYSIAAPAGYRSILSYVRCVTPSHPHCVPPARIEAQALMLAVAHNAATRRCTFQPQVIRALFGDAPALALSVDPVDIELVRGTDATLDVALERFGTIGMTAFEVGGLPPGTSARFEAPLGSGGALRLRVAAGANALPGEYELTITARAGAAVVQMVAVGMRVIAAPRNSATRGGSTHAGAF